MNDYSVDRRVRIAWLKHTDVETERRFLFDATFHAAAMNASYVVAALLSIRISVHRRASA